MITAAVALLGAVVYGAADFLGGLAAKRLRPILVTAAAATSGLVALAVAHPLIGGAWTAGDLLWGALAGVAGIASLALLYACLALGPMSILSPLTAVVSAVAPMLWGLLVDGDVLNPIGYAGLGVALIAVVLVGFVPGKRIVRPSGRGIAMAIGAGLAIGAFLIVLDQTTPSSGLVPLMAGRATTAVVAMAIIGVLTVMTLGRVRPAAALGSRRQAWWFAISCGVVDALANSLLLLALRQGDLSIVSALTALYPAGTILLAATVLRERVAPVQWVGLALALGAAGMLAAA
jgi:uncharacterized membrane protein